MQRSDLAGTKHWDVVRLALPTGEMTNLTDRYRTEERTDWTFWFPHAGTPSTIVSPDVGAPPLSTSDRAEVETPLASDAPLPDEQQAPLRGWAHSDSSRRGDAVVAAESTHDPRRSFLKDHFARPGNHAGWDRAPPLRRRTPAHHGRPATRDQVLPIGFGRTALADGYLALALPTG